MSAESFPIPDRAVALRETLTAVLALDSATQDQLTTVLARFAPEDVAAVLGDFSPEEKRLIYQALPSNEMRGVVLEATDHQSEREVHEQLTEEQRIGVLEEMPVDDLVDHLESLPPAEREKIIAHLDDEEARDVEELLRFAPDTAGGMMTTEYISVPSTVTSREALESIQGNISAEVIAYVYAHDPSGKLCGVASIRDILRAQPDTPMADYMSSEVRFVPAESDREEVAAVMDKYNHAAIPVVDSEQRMKGLITFDDVFDAVQEEHSEDMLRMAGTVAVHPFFESLLAGVWKRLPFLLLTMVGGFGIVAVIETFRQAIRSEVLTPSLPLIPLLIALSGNVAIVSSTIMVRGLATGEITSARLWRALGKEVGIGATIGFVLALIVSVSLFGMIRVGWFEVDAASGASLPWVCAFSLCAAIVVAALTGAMVPLLCRLTGKIDPAIASGPFVTMLCDLSASVIFLALVYLLST